MFVENHQSIIFLQAVANKVCLDRPYEVKIEESIDKQVYNFLDTIPDVVDMDPAVAISTKTFTSLLLRVLPATYLQTCRHPNDEDTDVD